MILCGLWRRGQKCWKILQVTVSHGGALTHHHLSSPPVSGPLQPSRSFWWKLCSYPVPPLFFSILSYVWNSFMSDALLGNKEDISYHGTHFHISGFLSPPIGAWQLLCHPWSSQGCWPVGHRANQRWLIEEGWSHPGQSSCAPKSALHFRPIFIHSFILFYRHKEQNIKNTSDKLLVQQSLKPVFIINFKAVLFWKSCL